MLFIKTQIARLLLTSLMMCLLLGAVVARAGVSVLTYHNNNERTGQNTNETILTPANVASGNFGQIFNVPVDGYVYAQPLVVTNVTIPGKGVHDVVYVATEHDSVYALDANSNTAPLWQVSFINPAAGISSVSSTFLACDDLVPEIGITGTPVIDPASGTIYVVAKTMEISNGATTTFFRLHALDLTSGVEKFGGPVIIQASVPGTGSGTDGAGNVPFLPRFQIQRAGLLLNHGIVYLGFASDCDYTPAHGWLFGYGAQSLMLSNVFNTTPNDELGGIWAGGGGPACDTNGNIYCETGNGAFDAQTNNDFGDSFLKLSPTNGLGVADYFAPSDQYYLNTADTVLGASGPVRLPDEVGYGGANRHLLIGAGKEGTMYLLNRDNMGHYNPTNDSQIVQELPFANGPDFGMPAYFNHQIYYCGFDDYLKDYSIANAQINTNPVSESLTYFAFPGSTPSVSANGTTNAIVWALQNDNYYDNGPALLHAYDATQLTNELYNSGGAGTRDLPGGAVKFAVPTVANGKVYVGAEYALGVFGLGTFLDAPVISPAGANFGNSISITITDDIPGTVIHYTLDGTPPNSASPTYTGPFTLAYSASVNARATKPGAIDSAVASASFYSSNFTGSGTGLTGNYYSGQSTTFTNPPTLVRTDATVNFDWGSSAPDPSISPGNFSVSWTGALQPQFNETYTFYATTEDGVSLWVNGQLIINALSYEPSTVWTATIALPAGALVPITMEYYDNDGNASASLAWSSPSTPESIIPQSQLYPVYAPAVAQVNWPAPTNVVYGTALGTNQNDANSALPGVYVYSPTNGTVLPAGTNTLTVTFTPSSTNYAGTNLSVSLVVTTAPLTVTVSNTSKTYGQTNPILGGTLSGLVNGDNITATYVTVATTGSPADSYAINPVLVDPNGRLGNYSVTTNSGTLTVNQALLVVAGNNTNRIYGAVNPAFTYLLAGFVNGDMAGVLSGSPMLTTAAATNSPVGSYPIVVTNGTLSATNYTLSFTNGALVVATAPLTVTVSNASKSYGQTNPVLGGTLSGLVNGDNITGTYVTAAATGSPAGGYAINPVLVDPNGRLGNYSVTTNSGTLTVNQALLVVAANNTNRVYGAVNPVFTYLVAGFVNGDTAGVLSGSPVLTTAAATNSPVGSYPVVVTIGTLSATNYSLNFTNGALIIATAPLTVTASNAIIVYGQTNPVLGGTLSGLVNGDNITATYVTAATTGSPAGSYAINPVLIDPNGRLGNYSVTTNSGTLTVNQALLVVAANNTNRVYGATNPVFTYTVGGFVNGDTAAILSGSPVLTTAAVSNSPVGNYPIVLTSGTLSATNYSLSFTNGVLTVNLAAPAISPAGGTFTNFVSVTVSDASPGAVIYYTLDGTTPTSGSTIYTGPFTLNNSATVNAWAYEAEAGGSAVASVVFYSSNFLGYGSGLTGTYYSGQLMTFSNPPTLVRTDATVNFNWGGGSPDPSISPDLFTVMWTGAIQPQFNEAYTFYTTASDGVRVWVNGHLVIDDWVDQLATVWNGSITLAAGQMVPITMEYFQNYDGGLAELAWSSPSTSLSIIPQSQLYPNYPAEIYSEAKSPTNGGFQLQMAGLTGKGYVLQGSSNLLSWISLQTNAPAPNPQFALPTNLFNFIDLGATNVPIRFYRMLQQP